MPNYIRNLVYGGTYFFTLVTNHRQNLFSDSANVEILLKAIQRTQVCRPFDLIAYCILHDHLHLLVSLPLEERSFPQIIRNIKRVTTIETRKQTRNAELIVWQDRFWEHTIRDEEDLQHHFDYIHFNPVKHGYVEDYEDWAWSSFHHYYKVNPKIDRIDTAKLECEKGSYGE